MKTETQIAKENVDELRKWDKRKEAHNLCSHRVGYFSRLGKCREHLQSCQRFLEFLEELRKYLLTTEWGCPEEVLDKITDLQNPIKIYKDGGVK